MILAIDQGTTSTRALMVSETGQITPLVSLPHGQHYPQPGWVEHDPAELLRNIDTCIRAGAEAGAVAIGLANQGESCLGWDARTGTPVGPVIVWQDARTSDVIAGLEAAGAGDEVLQRAGLPLDPYFSASKLGWILRHVPEAQRLASAGRLRLGTTDAWFRDRLTGRFETDVTTASRTSLMALDSCTWDAELCALFGVPIECLPRITPTTGMLGGSHDLPLTASVTDQQAALYGHGGHRAGQAKITFGTGAFALAVTGPLVRARGVLPTVAWQLDGADPVYALDGGVYAAASAVNWAHGLGLFRDYDDINRFDGRAIDRGLAFVPALAGLACPHWDRAARGAWLGLGLDTGPRDMMQALLEGVALRTGEVISAIEAAMPLDGPIAIDGGMTANPYFCQFLTDVLGQDTRRSDEAERTALGTAALAAQGMGLTLALPTAGDVLQPKDFDETGLARFRAAREAVSAFGATLPG
ncbi:FGGY family carbohydrate kinase [Flavimaricola marinus]|uniref:ATP:glycerol 3-phosphotransferase n=1 Tax=Flavimaricola marinus TaxID=1819565 RepID=A0A238LGB8_9RHOB|nr:FGGY family carbohydrate kinase [Flavimaricola marinus]SMY08613.1 Glycerol kinase [Flavimaricola marinus]